MLALSPAKLFTIMKIPIPQTINYTEFQEKLRSRLTIYDDSLWEDDTLEACIEATFDRVYPDFYLCKSIEAEYDGEYITFPADMKDLGIVFNNEYGIEVIPFTGLMPDEDGNPSMKLPDQYNGAKIIYSCCPYIKPAGKIDSAQLIAPNIEAMYLASLMVCLEFRVNDRSHYDASPVTTNLQSSTTQEVIMNSQLASQAYSNYAMDNKMDSMSALLGIEEITINPFTKNRTPTNPNDINYEGNQNLPR